MKISNINVELLDYTGSDLTITNSARVSFNKESSWETSEDIWGEDEHGLYQETINTLSEKDQKLISYLAKHNHWSPFAHSFLSFRIKAPIFVARQLVKHQVGGVWNEVSRRYVDEEPEFYLPDVWHARPENAKQGASEETIKIIMHYDIGTNEYWLSPIDRSTMNQTEQASNFYNDMLKAKVAPEEARMFLPLNTMTEWIWSGSLMFFARVCKQRLDLHAQNATREVAQMINNEIPKEFEHSWKALMV